MESTMELRKVEVVVDGLDGTYPAFSDGEEWNGFLVPMFDVETTIRILDSLIRVGVVSAHFFRAGAGGWVLHIHYADGRGQAISPDRVVVDGQLTYLYGLGAYEWTWLEAEPELTHMERVAQIVREDMGGMADEVTIALVMDGDRLADGLLICTNFGTQTGAAAMAPRMRQLVAQRVPGVRVVGVAVVGDNTVTTVVIP